MSKLAAFYTCDTRVPSAGQCAPFETRLSNDYRNRLRLARREIDRRETLAGVALLERSLATLGWDSPGLSRLEYPADGPPGWREGPRFSLSHTDGLIVCVVSDRARIGVDVERLRPIDPRVLRRVLDAGTFATLVERPAGVLGAWTAMEAVLKAAGATLRRIAEVRLSAEGSIATFDAQTWYLRPLAVPSGYIATVASDAPRIEMGPAVAA
jgi:4'-phosphopantetheinyl transferase